MNEQRRVAASIAAFACHLLRTAEDYAYSRERVYCAGLIYCTYRAFKYGVHIEVCTHQSSIPKKPPQLGLAEPSFCSTVHSIACRLRRSPRSASSGAANHPRSPWSSPSAKLTQRQRIGTVNVANRGSTAASKRVESTFFDEPQNKKKTDVAFRLPIFEKKSARVFWFSLEPLCSIHDSHEGKSRGVRAWPSTNAVQLWPLSARGRIMPERLTRLFSSADDSSGSSDTSDSSSELWARSPAGRFSLPDYGNRDGGEESPSKLALPGLVAALRASRARSSAAQAKASR